MFSKIFLKRHLTSSILSVTCIALLSGCNYLDAVHNAMPKGYTHHTTKPLSEPRLTHSYDDDIYFEAEQVEGQSLIHKDKVDQLLEQMIPTLRTVSAEDSIFLVSEQKNRDFDDALRLGLRNLGLKLDLSSMGRYQMIYTARKANRKDFEAMSIMPERAEISKFKFYALRLVDTLHGQPIAEAYLIPGYNGFKVPQGYTAANEAIQEQAPVNSPPHSAIKAQPVMDNSPMLAPVEDASEDKIDEAYSHDTMPANNASYGKVYSAEAAPASQQPMPMAITDGNTKNITAQ